MNNKYFNFLLAINHHKSIAIVLSFLILLIFQSQAQGWFQQQSGTTYLLWSVDFIDSMTGWAVGQSGTIRATTNGGANWYAQNSGTTFDIKSVCFVNNNTGWIAAGNGVRKTTNGGSNWFSQGNLFAISNFFIDVLTGWVVGEPEYGPPLASKTTDGGLNWISQGYDLSGLLFSVFFANNSSGWVAGEYGIWASTNGGTNWSHQSLGYTRQVFFINSLTGWAVDVSSIIKKTTNGGNLWINIQTGGEHQITSIYFINELRGWGVGIGGTIISTTNGGLNWIKQSSGTTSSLASVCFVDSLTGWAVGINGVILKTTTGGFTPISNFSSEIPKEFVLYQNFPNPFNPSTKIRFEIPKRNSVKLVILDVLGREVTTLISQELKPGSYEIDWDASNYSSGIYYYELETDAFKITKKMAVLK